MHPPSHSTGQVAYLLTTFPKLSERFLQRELEGLARHTDLRIDIHSMIGGQGERFEGFPIIHFRARDWLLLPFRLLRELLRCPEAFLRMALLNDAHPPRSVVNALEHYLGLAFAIVRAADFRRRPPRSIHAVWATGPASAAFFLSLLNERPFSMGCHAYDLFRHGGDALLPEKLRAARFIHTTTQQARDELIRRGAAPAKIVLIRRSAPRLSRHEPPAPSPPTEVAAAESTLRQPGGSAPAKPIRILSVGRLIEKKGFFELLEILRHLIAVGMPLRARIIGDGPLRASLQARIHDLGLQSQVELVGQLQPGAVEAEYRHRADVLFFTGRVALSGDRDGLPNVIVEAMAAGIPVFASPAGGVAEAIQSGVTGELLDPRHPEQWLHALQRIQTQASYLDQLRENARTWVLEHCDPQTNALALSHHLLS